MNSSVPAAGSSMSPDALEHEGGPEHHLPDLGKVSDRRVAGVAAADLAARVATVVLGIFTTALLARTVDAELFQDWRQRLAEAAAIQFSGALATVSGRWVSNPRPSAWEVLTGVR